jgi:dipeptidyl-peptidase-3
MKVPRIISLLALLVFFAACQQAPQTTEQENTDQQQAGEPDLQVKVAEFADLKVYQYEVPGFDQLSLKEKQLLYYLSQAAYAGRDITWDQNYKHNLAIRQTLERIWETYSGDRSTEDFAKFKEYTQRVWFSNGIHHHYGNEKILPEFSQAYFAELVNNSEVENKEATIATLGPVMQDPNIAPKKVNKSSDADVVAKSAVNFYGDDLTQAEVEAYYESLKPEQKEDRPISYGLNSKVVKEGGKVVEKVWKVGGMYTEAIEKIVYWLEKAVEVAENDAQREALEKLVTYYKSGDLADFDAYSIAWVNDTDSKIDVINGFIEVYSDPLGMKGSFESVVSHPRPGSLQAHRSHRQGSPVF